MSVSYARGAQDEQKNPAADDVFIYQIAPDKRGGKAYKLVYFVKAPIDSYWKFKTDFDNEFLTKNKYIREHNLILQKYNTVITENKYTNGPDVYFRWRTTVLAEAYRLESERYSGNHYISGSKLARRQRGLVSSIWTFPI